MSKTKQPIYRGPRKNHASVFIANDYDDKLCRIRIFHSQKVKVFSDGLSKFEYRTDIGDLFGRYELKFQPCYASNNMTEREVVRAMKKFDKNIDLKTVFLGYVKDCE